MGLFDKFFPKQNTTQAQEAQTAAYFQTLTGYTPAFTSYQGGLYEMDLTRSIIRTFSRHCGKLKPEVNGSGNEVLARNLQNKPNPYQTTPQMLERLATIYEMHNTAFLVPLEDSLGKVTGVFPIMPQLAELKEHKGKLFLVYHFGAGLASIEFDRVGVIVQDQYKDDFFGDDNSAMDSTLDMIHAQHEGIVEGIKQSAHIRFIAKLAQTLKGHDIEETRKRFISENLTTASGGGVIMYDNKLESVTPIESKPWMVDAEQMAQIKSNAFNYFGCNENILQNNFTSDQWNAYYEGKIEPFAIKTSIALTYMHFTERERAHGNNIILTANRLQYLSNEEKLATVTQLFDRGMLMTDEGLDIFNMAPLPDGKGQKRFIRKEYVEYNELTKEDEKEDIIPIVEMTSDDPPDEDAIQPDDEEEEPDET